ncbi:MAG: ribosome biogenesis GTP-binding protein YihA/YsxC [Leptospiraceae bacterium]|nr:ribosome biogenesis GTP-binding protein YihA/YsxC [Leptospiraceae bacterium]MDW7975345.1 ribosome biogenesis GTP-binding protein YihA/YsxC [Leptospiraceae bacterium]
MSKISYFPNARFYRAFSHIEAINQAKIPPIPVVAITGRSNSGKSSLINALCNHKDLAKTSSKPGKTRTINYYYIPSYKNLYKEFFLVDLPGYGYSEATKTEIQNLRVMIDQYIAKNPHLKILLLIVDVRREFQEEELSIIDYCLDHQKPFFVIRSKWDKLKHNERIDRIARWKLEPLIFEKSIAVSSLKKENLHLVVEKIMNALQN